jgi:hypothetical protein
LLTRNHRQEALCRAYIQAIAARSGMSSSMPAPDYGTDLSLHDIETHGNRRSESGYRLDIQAKSTTLAKMGPTQLRYDLRLKDYEYLRHPAPGCPRFLVVLILPRDEADWVAQSEAELLVRRCAYWVGLKGRGSTTNRKQVRVAIPRANVFSVEALQDLMQRYKRGEWS